MKGRTVGHRLMLMILAASLLQGGSCGTNPPAEVTTTELHGAEELKALREELERIKRNQPTPTPIINTNTNNNIIQIGDKIAELEKQKAEVKDPQQAQKLNDEITKLNTAKESLENKIQVETKIAELEKQKTAADPQKTQELNAQLEELKKECKIVCVNNPKASKLN